MSSRKSNSPHKPSWLVASKISPPQSSRQVIDRPRLLRKLNAARESRLSLIRASAGYGKTTLLAQWRDKLVAKGVAVGWLTLDEEDRDASQLMAYLTWSLSQSRVAVGELLAGTAKGVMNVPIRSALAALLKVLTAAKTDVVLILDDYHRARSKEVDDFLGFFIQHLPGNVHLVIASRELPQFGWAYVKAQGDLVELGVADLQFAVQEVKSLVGSDRSIELSELQLEELAEKTEGWVLGLQLATMYMERQPTGAVDFSSFSGRTIEVTDYLVEQVFQDLPQDVQAFLMKTSVLERFNGDLANAICDRDDSWEIIAQLYQRNLFIFFLDEEREWCRYHHLFADFLNEKLRRQGSETREQVHARAADWFRRNGLFPEAVRHALRSGSLELVAEIVEKAGGWRLALTGHASILRKVYSRLPDTITRRYPRLWLGDILLSAKAGRLDDAHRKLRELQWEGAGKPGADELLTAERQTIDILVAGYEDRLVTENDLEEIERSVRRPGVNDDLVLALLNNYLCLLYLDAGRFDQSINAGRKSVNYFRNTGNTYAEKLINTHIGQACLAQGHLTEAAEIYRGIYDDTLAHFGDDDDATAIANVLLAEAAYEQNDLETAEQRLEQSLPHIEKFDGWFDIYASGYTTAASLAHITQGIDAAMAILDRAEEMAHRRRLDRLGRMARLHRIRELTLEGEMRLAEVFAVEFEPFEEAEKARHSELLSWRLLEAAGSSLAGFSIRKNDPERALAILMPLQVEAEARGWIRSSMKLQVKLALAHDALGHKGAALTALEQSLLLATPQKFMRFYLDEGEPGKQLLQLLLRRDAPLIPAVENFVNGLLSERTTGRMIFSEREREVLDLLGDGCSTKEMAFRLGLSANTIKYHRKKLYGKLGATSRSQAVAAARKLSLVS